MLESKAKWTFFHDQKEEKQISDHIKLSRVTKMLLAQRNIIEAEEIEAFLQPELSHLIDPIYLDSIDRARDRLLQAIEREEKILIFGDYDADGVTATVVLLKTLRELGAACDYYIPNRFTEGYGPNKEAFKQAREDGFTVIVTVDTGIAAIEEAAYAKSLGIDLIITDHHETVGELPDAYAIIHPKLSEAYSFKDLAGVGIAFKLAQHLLGFLPEEYLDLVAVGTIADLVPLKGENRVFAWHGLQRLAGSTNSGLKALKEVCSLEDAVDAEDVAFSIAPRINAVGRLQDASLAVELLMCETRDEATELAQTVHQLNTRRQKLVRDTVGEAVEILNQEPLKNFILVAKEGWNEGILGIVASHLVQKYDRPALVMSIQKEKGIAKGSARSIPAFDLFKNLHKMNDSFINFGGHSQAAGLTIALEELESLPDLLHDMVAEQLDPSDFRQEINISGELEGSDINENLVQEINMLAPFGMGNPKPLFLFKHIPYEIRQIGRDKNHLKLRFQTDGGSFEGIGFGMGEAHPFITPNTPVKIVGELNINEWNGFRQVQMVMQDIKISQRQLYDHRDKRHLSLELYFKQEADQVVISEGNSLDQSMNGLEVLSYEAALEKVKRPIDDLFLFDLPQSLSQLKQLVAISQPKNIHACYRLDNSVYLTPFPTREDFAWVYRFIHQFGPLPLKQALQGIAERKQWPQELVAFMLQVFTDLNFILEEDGQISMNPEPAKKELQESQVYQQRIERIEIEKILHYTNAKQLQEWFIQEIEEGLVKEEVTHGL